MVAVVVKLNTSGINVTDDFRILNVECKSHTESFATYERTLKTALIFGDLSQLLRTETQQNNSCWSIVESPLMIVLYCEEKQSR